MTRCSRRWMRRKPPTRCSTSRAARHGNCAARTMCGDFYEFMGAPLEDVDYRQTPGWVDWYDTEESQRILQYQNRSYERYSDEMRAIVEALMAE